MSSPPFVQHLSAPSVPTADGGSMPIEAQIPEQFAWVLHDMVARLEPDTAIEVGMATGTSALAILSAMDERHRGRLVSIDPNQSTHWRGAGVTAVAMHGLAGRHTLVERPDYLALPELLDADTRIQFAYVDGWHTFDYVALDAFFVDRMLDVGGVVGFNDCGWPAVRKALRYLTTHRRYEEVATGLPRHGDGSKLRTVLNVVRNHRPSDRYFRKLEDWEPDWDFYRRF